MFLIDTPEGLRLHPHLAGIVSAGHVELDLAEPAQLHFAAALSAMGRASDDAGAEVDAVLESLGIELGDDGALASVLTQCRVCGCTDFDACIDAGGEPCGWAEPDLCTGCAPLVVQPRSVLVHAEEPHTVGERIPGRFDQPKDWNLRMAILEGEAGDPEIGAGRLAIDPVFDDEEMPGRMAGMSRVLEVRHD